jgi:hypothetical protein
MMRKTLTVTLTLLATNARANVLGMFPAGTGCKSAAMETAGDCAEPQTLAYNPALLSSLKPGFYGEVGVGRLEYGYEHPSFDPVHVNVVSPLASGGWKSSFAGDRGSYGFAVIPASLADLKIRGLPRRVSGNVTSLNVHATRKLAHLPIGASYTLGDSGFDAGATLLYTYDHRTLSGATVENPDSELVNMTSSGSFFRPIAGLSWHKDEWAAGASYMAPLRKNFKGTTKIATESDPFPTEQVEYDPSVLMTNVSSQVDSWRFSLNVNHLFASPGKTIQRDGLNRKTSRADLKDVNHYGVRSSYKTERFGEYSLAMAWLDSYWGDGYFYKDSDGITHHEIGHIFGQFNALPLKNQSITWRQNLNEWMTHVALYRSSGSVTTGPGADNPGFYQMEFISLTCGLSKQI